MLKPLLSTLLSQGFFGLSAVLRPNNGISWPSWVICQSALFEVRKYREKVRCPWMLSKSSIRLREGFSPFLKGLPQVLPGLCDP